MVLSGCDVAPCALAAYTPPMAVSTAERVAPAQQDQHKGSGGGEFLLVGGAFAALAAFLLLNRGSTPPPSACACDNGASCNPQNGKCSAQSGQAANLATGLYVTYFDPTDTVGTIWWVDKGQGRWGVPTQAQLTRCFGANPHIIDASTVGGFGFADHLDNDYIVTVGDITACAVCPPGSPGAASGA